MSTAASLSGPDPEPTPAGEDVERYLPRFLLWLWEAAEGEVDVPVSCAPFAHQQAIPRATVAAVVGRLRGDAKVHVHGDGAAQLTVSLCGAGVREARALRDQRSNPAERQRYARQAVLSWILARTESGPLDINTFFDSPEVFFLGAALTPGEVAHTISYLAGAGLITCDGPPFQDGPGSVVALTPLGTDAALLGADIGEFVERQRERARPAAGDILYGPVGVVNHDVTVHGDQITQQALSPAQLGELIRQFGGRLALDDHERERLLRGADSLTSSPATPGPEPGPGPELDTPGPDTSGPEALQPGADDPEATTDDTVRQRGLLRHVRDILEAAPDTVGRQLLLNALVQTVGRLGGG